MKVSLRLTLIQKGGLCPLNENKIIIGDVNCTMKKIDRDGENKTPAL